MNDWDRAYIEHLIRRDQRIQAEEESRDENLRRLFFSGRGRYYWDLGSWPEIQGVKSHHEYLVTVCPLCHTRLHYSLRYHYWSDDTPQHAPGCEFFRNEQRQWVDDWAELKAGSEVIRPPTDTECLLLYMLRLVPSPKPRACYRRYYVTVHNEDGEPIRSVRAHIA